MNSLSTLLPADAAACATLLQTVLSGCSNGVIFLRPVYATNNRTVIEDFSYVYLNPWAQQMLQLPECPDQTMLTLYPYTVGTGSFALYVDAFRSGQAAHYEANYQYGSLASHFRLAVQRSGEWLVVSFTDTARQQEQDSLEQKQRGSQARPQVQEWQPQPENHAPEQTPQSETTPREAEQEHLLSQILELVPAAIATLSGPEHRYSFFNERYQTLSGNRAKLGKTVAEVFPEMVSQGFTKLLDAVFATGEPCVGVERPVQRYNPATGATDAAYIDFIYQPLRTSYGQTTGILASILDSTEKVRARQAIEASEHQLRLLTDALPVLIGYLDREEKYRFANHAYQAWFKQDPASLLGRPVREVVGEQAYQKVQTYIKQALAGERIDFEATMPYREGFTKHISTSYVPDLQDGTVIGFYTLVTDVTEQTLARQQVQAANEELHRSNERLLRTNADLDTFVYAASHDLKAPIANIEGLLDALREHLPASAQQAGPVPHPLDMMRGAVERFQRTISQLTDISRLQSALEQPAERVAVAALLEDVRLDLAPLLDATGAHLTLDATCPTLRGMTTKNLRSILYNLISNALKYRAPDRAPVVQVRCRGNGTETLLEVQDNGLGLSEEQQRKLFTLFRRLHDHVEGSGVGLYMVKRMVENAGGTITVQSQLHVGSTFRVAFPASSGSN